MNRLATILLGCLVLGPAKGLAFEWLPEFQSLGEEEPGGFEGPEHLGSEYTSDIHSYGRPLAWESKWLTSDIAFDGVAGSTSSTRFVLDARAKARAQVLPGRLDFRFTWFDHSDQERESRHVVLEVVTWLHRWVGVSVYGEPAMHKRQADLGAALLVRPGANHEARLFYTAVDLETLPRGAGPHPE